MRHLQRLAAAGVLAAMLITPELAIASSPKSSTRIDPGHSAVIWADRSASGSNELAQVIVEAKSEGFSTLDTSATAGCEMRGLNAYGWTLWRYTLSQSFNYNGTSITYFPAGTKTTEGNWGWYDNGSTDPAEYWISNPTSAYSIGTYAFRRDIQDLHESRNGWVRADIRGTGAWWCSGA